jgi:Flp pilus assembly protein TadG
MSTTGIFERLGGVRLTRTACSLRSCTSSVWARFRSPLRPFVRDERGSALMEFALVAPPFFLLLIGTLEVALMYFAGAVMEGATKEAARQIRTGQVQMSADPLATFQGELCGSLAGLIDCSKIVFNVQTFSSFSAASMPIELDEDGEIINTSFSPGGSSAVTIVRAMYRWNFMTPLIDKAMPAGLGGHLLVSTVAFQTEPYNVN